MNTKQQEKLWRHSQNGFSWASRQRTAYRLGHLTRSEIRKLEKDLDWQWEVADTAAENKVKLLEMACNGESRPHQKKHPLGPRLCSYTRKNGTSFDAKFDREICSLAPEWFVNSADENKAKLLEMARNGEPRPHQKKHPLGTALGSYIRKSHNSYDPEFEKEIRIIASHWFVNTADENKVKLLEMAHNEEPRPSQTSQPLGKSLSRYTGQMSECYDPEFDKKIRCLAPHWFVDTAAENKIKILEMARTGELRPNNKTHPLGKALGHYIGKNSTCYDHEFTQEIRSLAPHWFKK
jgi:hypothetical protein